MSEADKRILKNFNFYIKIIDTNSFEENYNEEDSELKQKLFKVEKSSFDDISLRKNIYNSNNNFGKQTKNFNFLNNGIKQNNLFEENENINHNYNIKEKHSLKNDQQYKIHYDTGDFKFEKYLSGDQFFLKMKKIKKLKKRLGIKANQTTINVLKNQLKKPCKENFNSNLIKQNSFLISTKINDSKNLDNITYSGYSPLKKANSLKEIIYSKKMKNLNIEDDINKIDNKSQNVCQQSTDVNKFYTFLKDISLMNRLTYSILCKKTISNIEVSDCVNFLELLESVNII